MEDEQNVKHLQDQAREVVAQTYEQVFNLMEKSLDRNWVRLVWFSKVLENWKAMVIVLGPDPYYFEVTYSGANKDTQVDMYQKVHERRIVHNEVDIDTGVMQQGSSVGEAPYSSPTVNYDANGWK